MKYYKHVCKKKLPYEYREWDYHATIDYYCFIYDVNPVDIYALIMTESAGDTLAIRYEPNYMWTYDYRQWATKWRVSLETSAMLQKTSFGLCQLMGSVFIQLGFEKIPLIYLDVTNNIKAGIKFWVLKRKQYGSNPLDLYAAYNAGSVRYADNGNYVNQSAVTRYRRHHDEIKRAFEK
jgi:hypothetical protein